MPKFRIFFAVIGGLSLIAGGWLLPARSLAGGLSHHERVALLIGAIEDPAVTSAQRNESATELKEYVAAHPKARYSDAEIDAMARIVAENRDDTRFWAAAALFLIGPRAGRAVPTLRTAYDEAFCQTPPPTARRRYGPSTLDTLTGALAVNGVHPRPPICPAGSPPLATSRTPPAGAPATP